MTQETGGMTIIKLQEKPLTRHIRQTELKITRNDDSGHTPRLQTTGNCLSGKIFRCKITSYGASYGETVQPGPVVSAWKNAMFNLADGT